MNGTEQMNALLGNKQAPGGGTVEKKDWKAEYEALKAQYDHDKAMIGRVKASDNRVKELESEIAKLKSERGGANVPTLTPEEKGEIPDEYVGAAATLASRAAGNAVAGVSEEIAELRREREAEKAAARERMANDFAKRIDRRYPGFLSSIGAGGDKHDAWESFLVNNAASVQVAYANCDYDSLVYHIDRFYREVLEVRPPNGEKGNATAPDPVPHGGGNPRVVDSEKTYTAEEYAALDEKCMKLRREGRFDEYRQLRDELDSALSEGRVKDE